MDRLGSLVDSRVSAAFAERRSEDDAVAGESSLCPIISDESTVLCRRRSTWLGRLGRRALQGIADGMRADHRRGG